jgi:hypothetical protein
MLAGWNQADSRRTSAVPSATSVSDPPITPATATARSTSAIKRSSSVNVRSTPSMVTSRSPSSARRTTIPGPASRCRSKGCRG